MSNFAEVTRRAPFLIAIAIACAAAACGGSSKPRPEEAGTVHAVTDQLTAQGVTVATLVCHGRAPGIIDCAGAAKDGRVIAATLQAQSGPVDCHGSLIINLAGVQAVTLADTSCH